MYGGPNGAVAQLHSLLEWVDKQRAFSFYSSSILLLYEGDAAGAVAGGNQRGRGGRLCSVQADGPVAIGAEPLARDPCFPAARRGPSPSGLLRRPCPSVAAPGITAGVHAAPTPLPPPAHLADAAGAKVRVRLVDFAHSFRPASPRRDDNFYRGLASLAQRLQHVQAADLPDSIGC